MKLSLKVFLFFIVALGASLWSFNKIKSIEEPHYIQPEDSSMRIDLLEKGIANHMESLGTCRETIDYNTLQFKKYVANHRASTSSQNLRVEALERDLVRLNNVLENQVKVNKILQDRINDESEQ